MQNERDNGQNERKGRVGDAGSRKALRSDAAGRVYGQHGGFRKLKAYQVAELVYDYTCRFCDRYIPKKDRHHDQMVQAARSGYQNIAEGSEDSATSRKLSPFRLFFFLFLLLTPTAHAILAGGEFDLPADSPSNRLDPLGATSPFNFVGALSIFTGSQKRMATDCCSATISMLPLIP